MRKINKSRNVKAVLANTTLLLLLSVYPLRPCMDPRETNGTKPEQNAGIVSQSS